ncbi:MAG: peptidylprolyl isomerase [Bacilli bacterium]|nr:peptidylprolyl isomerase [Bacilli bacterium]
MKNKIFVFLVIIFLITGCGKIPQLADGKEAIVSFEESSLNISADDLYNELKDKYALNILIDMIDKTILLKEYPEEADNAKEDAKTQLDTVKNYYVGEDGKYNEESLLSDLAQHYGLSTVEAFEEMLKLSYYRNLAIKDYAKSELTNKQIESYYKTDVVGDISAKHILIAVSATDDMDEEKIEKLESDALKTAKKVIKELDNGAKFEDLAKEYSDDESNAEKGGDLGYFNKGDMVTEFENAAYALKIDDYSKTPVKTSFGYHIILKTGEKDKAELKDVKEEIIETLSTEALSTDNTLSLTAMIELRESYGFNIEDSNVNKKYSTYISNQLISLRTNSEQEQS